MSMSMKTSARLIYYTYSNTVGLKNVFIFHHVLYATNMLENYFDVYTCSMYIILFLLLNNQLECFNSVTNTK